MENAHLNDEQQQIFDNINNIDSGLYFIEGTPGSGKTFFIKYLTNHLIQTTEKKILLYAPTGAAATKLSPNTSTIHTLFKLPIRGPLYALQQSNLTLQRLQAADVIIVDEMSMITTVQLTSIYSRLKQVSEYNSDPFHSKILLCVGDMAQLPSICFHSVTDSEPVCRRCCIINSPIWTSGKHFTLTNSIRHSKDPEYLYFLNIIRKRRPIEEEIQQYLGDCFIPEPDVLSSLDDATTILCTHCEDVDMYNNFMVSNIFHESAIHSIDVRSNATNIDELQGWLHDPDFNQIKTVAMGCLVMLTVNINLERGLANGTPASV
jgi:hypothetical protein